MQPLSKFLRSALSFTVALATVLIAVAPVQATAPPPAGTLCAIIQGLCDPAVPPQPDFRMTVRSGSTTVTVTSNTRVSFGTTLQANNANEFTLSAVRFYDAAGVLTPLTQCYAFRVNVLAPSIGVVSPQNVQIPWKQAVNNEPWGPTFGPNQVKFTDIPRSNISNVEIGISCDYLGVTHRRSVLFQLRGAANQQTTPSMSFNRQNPPSVSAADPAQTGTAKLYWRLTGDVGVCKITEVRNDGDYTPGIGLWGGDSYIKEHAIDGANLAGVDLEVRYPSRPGSYRYTFSLSCDNVSGTREQTILATRTNGGGGGGGAGAGNVLDYGRGTRQF